MKISSQHTFVVALLNAIYIIFNLLITIYNKGWIVLEPNEYKTLDYLSEIFLLYTLVYLLIAFKNFDRKNRFAGFVVYIFFITALYFLAPTIPLLINGGAGIIFSILSLLSFINICYLAIISLKLTYRPLATAYFLFFISIVITTILPVIAPMVLSGLVDSLDSYFYFMTFNLLITPLLRFYVLYQINMGLKHSREEVPEIA
jgi:hypothetical protein